MSIVYTPASSVDLSTLQLFLVNTSSAITLAASSIGSYCLLSGGTGAVTLPASSAFSAGQFLALKNQNTTATTINGVTGLASLAANATAVVVRTPAGLIVL